MRATRRVYAVALGAVSLVLVGSMVGVAAYAANGRPAGRGAPGTQALDSSGPRDLGGWIGGMMGDWGRPDSGGSPAVTLEKAKGIADSWVATNVPGATADAGFLMPMGYVFTVSRAGSVVARIVVDDDTGRVLSGRPGAGGGGMMGQGWAAGGS